MSTLSGSVKVGQCANSYTNSLIGVGKSAFNFEIDPQVAPEIGYLYSISSKGKEEGNTYKLGQSAFVPLPILAACEISEKMGMFHEQASSQECVTCSMNFYKVVTKDYLKDGAEFKDNAKALLASNPKEFFNEYGDCYVSEVSHGIKASIKIDFRTDSDRKRDELKAQLALKVQGAGIAFDSEFSKFLDKYNIKYNISLLAQGVKIAIPESVKKHEDIQANIDEIQKYLEAGSAAINPVPLFIKIEHYKDFSPNLTFGLENNVRDCKRIRTALKECEEIFELCATSNYQTEESRRSFKNKKGKLNSASAYINANITASSPDSKMLNQKLQEVTKYIEEANNYSAHFNDFYKPTFIRLTPLSDFKMRCKYLAAPDKINLSHDLTIKSAKSFTFDVKNIQNLKFPIAFGYYDDFKNFKTIIPDITKGDGSFLIRKEDQDYFKSARELMFNYRINNDMEVDFKKLKSTKIECKASTEETPPEILYSPIRRRLNQ